MVSESVPAAFCYGCMVSESVPAVLCYGYMVSERVPAAFCCYGYMVSESVPAVFLLVFCLFSSWRCGVRENAQLLQQLQVDEFAVIVVVSENAQCYGSSVRVRSFMPIPWKHGRRKKCSYFFFFLSVCILK